MELTKLIGKAGKRIDITKFMKKALFSKRDYVTVNVFPLEVRQDIQAAKTKGLNTEYLNTYMLDNPGKDFVECIKDKEFVKNYFTPEWDPEAVEYKVKALVYGIDPDNHSFTENKQPVKLTKEVYETFYNKNRQLFNYLLEQVEKYNQEMSLGEKKGAK